MTDGLWVLALALSGGLTILLFALANYGGGG